MLTATTTEVPDDDPMAPFSKPARRFIADAVPIPDGVGFNALWAGPGMMPDYVYLDNDPQIFDTKEEAEAKAREVLFSALNKRRMHNEAPVRYQRMESAEFAARLAETGLNPSEFAEIWGTQQQTVLSDWIDGAGKMGIPFPMWWVLDFLRVPQIRDRVKAIAKKHVTLRDPDRVPGGRR